MQTMFDIYLSGRVAQDHHKELLRQAEVERRAPVRGNGNGKLEMLGEVNPAESLQDGEEAERLGHQLGRVIYCCYSELLDRGLRQDEAVELTKGLIDQLARNGLS